MKKEIRNHLLSLTPKELNAKVTTIESEYQGKFWKSAKAERDWGIFISCKLILKHLNSSLNRDVLLDHYQTPAIEIFTKFQIQPAI